MELLRKKVVSLEERLAGKTDVERAKDEESVRSRKLMKLAENYKRELNEAHAELRDLRARLLTVSDLQVCTAVVSIGRLLLITSAISLSFSFYCKWSMANKLLLACGVCACVRVTR
jgi:hypothetical protein